MTGIAHRTGAGLAVAPAAGPATADSHTRRTMRIVVPLPAGGGTDTFGRLITPHLGNHISGNPTVIAENVTGAGGCLGSNGVFRLRTATG